MEATAIVKYLLLFLSAPLWLPFAKALWGEFLKDMRPDGGLVGPIPTPVQRKEIERRISREFPSQVHEPKPSYRRGAAAAIARHQERENAKANEAKGKSNGPKAGPQAGGSNARFRRR